MFHILFVVAYSSKIKKREKISNKLKVKEIVPSKVYTTQKKKKKKWGAGGISSVQSLSSVWLFATLWTAACQASLSITNSQSLLKLMSIESVMPSNHFILCYRLLLSLQSLPASGFFPMSYFFTSGGQSIGVSASASVLPMNIQDWFPLGWTGWISLQSKGLSRVFSNTTVQRHQFFGTQLSLWSTSPIHTWLLEKTQLWLYGPFFGKVMSAF